MCDGGCRMFGIGSQKTEVGSQKSEVGSQKSEVGSQKSEVRRECCGTLNLEREAIEL